MSEPTTVTCGGCGGTGRARMTDSTPCCRCAGTGSRTIDDTMLAELRERVVCVSGAEVEGLLDMIAALRVQISNVMKCHEEAAQLHAAAEKRATDAEAYWGDVSRLVQNLMPHMSNTHAGAKRIIERYGEMEKRLADAEKHDAETADKWLAVNQLLIKERVLTDRLAKIIKTNHHVPSPLHRCDVCDTISDYDTARKSH